MRSVIKVVILLSLVLLGCFGPAAIASAANTLSITAEATEVGLRDQTTVTVSLIDENRQLVAYDGRVLVRVSRGGAVEAAVLKDGLPLKGGTAKFTFLAPAKAGAADILVIDPTSNLSAKLSLQVTDQAVQAQWKGEFAEVVKVKGKVAVKLDGKTTWDAALAGTKLHERDSVMTWDKSWVTLRLFDNSEVTLQPATTLYIKSLKSSSADPKVKQSVFRVSAGRVLAKAKEYLGRGSRFEIESESATAGVRGTYFEFISTLQGEAELLVYQGSVYFEHLQRETAFLLSQGQRLRFSPSDEGLLQPENHNLTAEQRDSQLEQEQAAAGEEPATESGQGGQGVPSADKEAKDESEPLRSSRRKTSVVFGSQRVGDTTYLALRFQPEFRKILRSGLSVGLDLGLYQDPQSGDLKLLSPDPDTQVGNFINWAEYDGKHLYLRYGGLENISYDYGLLFSDYRKEQAKGVQVGVKNFLGSEWGTRILAPFDVRAFSPWTVEATSTLYAGRATIGWRPLGLPLETGLTVVTDTNEDLRQLDPSVPTAGAALDLSLPLSKLATPYVEVAQLSEFGAGAEVGLRGQLSPRVWYQTGLRRLGERFVPNYFGGDYEVYKKNTLAGSLDGRLLPHLNDAAAFPETNGYFVKAGAGFGSLVDAKVSYESYSDLADISPVFTAEVTGHTPKISVLPALEGGLKYQQLQFKEYTGGANSWLNKNSSYSWWVTCPVTEGLYATLTNKFIPSDASVEYTREISLSMKF